MIRSVCGTMKSYWQKIKLIDRSKWKNDLKASIPSYHWEKFWGKSQTSYIYENIRKITAKHIINGTSTNVNRSKYKTSRLGHRRACEGTQTFLQAQWKHHNCNWKDNYI